MTIGIIVIVIIVAVGAAGIIIFSQQKTKKLSTPIAENKKTPEPTSSLPTKHYYDPSGFGFDYPNNLFASAAANIKDQSVYAELTVSSLEKKGEIEIQVLSSSLKNIDAWLKENKINPEEEQVKNLKLGDLEALQIVEKGTITTVAVDLGTLFLITTDFQNDKNYWAEVNNNIISSFEFIQPTSTSNGSNDNFSSDDVVLESEEVIE